MIKKDSGYYIAIVGAGPRGLSALESLIIEAAARDLMHDLRILLFEASHTLGCSHVYDPSQIETNWININERILLLESRPEIKAGRAIIPGFPSYHDWCGYEISEDMDHYPPRAKVGSYLNARIETLTEVLIQIGILEIFHERVDRLLLEDNAKLVNLITQGGAQYDTHQVLLTIGHQDTKPDPQLSEWINHVTDHKGLALFTAPYPISQYKPLPHIEKKMTIGLRGFGLAMIDIVRGIIDQEGGKLTRTDEATLSYHYEAPVRRELKFVPFSLDGLPLGPKPKNKIIDSWFKPAECELSTFRKIISDPSTQAHASDESFLINAICPIVANIYSKLKLRRDTILSQEELSDICRSWLQGDVIEHKLCISKTLSTYATMKSFVKMALGTSPVSLDYCIGQVWRHCEPLMYDALSYNACSDDVSEKIIALDERLKRYAFGPPIDSLQQIIALVDADVINLQLIKDPDITLTDEGWILSKDDIQCTVAMMINTLVDAPNVSMVNTPLVSFLLSENIIEPFAEDLGIETDAHGFLSGADQEQLPIAVLGRMAKGTLLGVDAILECFGDRPKEWARHAVLLADRNA